ncbi:MAG: ECF transporter S component [Lachnospiraceae bacterium]|nr:ECF transporter S component [Lachnospiraceae bacterium]
MNTNSDYVKKIVTTALFTAMTCVATMIIQIPSPMSGYVNLGDCLVLLSAWTLGPIYGACSAGIGSAMADILTGYAYYAPGTLLIKTLMAFTAGMIAQKARKNEKASFLPQLTGSVLAETIMTGGYFCYAALLLGRGLAAAASIPGNIVQGIFGAAAALLLSQVFEKSRVLSHLNI